MHLFPGSELLRWMRSKGRLGHLILQQFALRHKDLSAGSANITKRDSSGVDEVVSMPGHCRVGSLAGGRCRHFEFTVLAVKNNHTFQVA